MDFHRNVMMIVFLFLVDNGISSIQKTQTYQILQFRPRSTNAWEWTRGIRTEKRYDLNYLLILMCRGTPWHFLARPWPSNIVNTVKDPYITHLPYSHQMADRRRVNGPPGGTLELVFPSPDHGCSLPQRARTLNQLRKICTLEMLSCADGVGDRGQILKRM